MKPFAVIVALRATYDNEYANEIFGVMLEPLYRERPLEERRDLMGFLNDGFAFQNVMRRQPHQNWYLPDVKEFLQMYEENFTKDNPIKFAMVVEFFEQLATYTALMLTEPPRKEEWPHWFWAMYLMPAIKPKPVVEEKPIENETIVLIEQLWIDSLENHPSSSSGYEVKGYTKSLTHAARLITDAGDYVGEGWPVPKDQTVPKLKMKVIPLLT